MDSLFQKPQASSRMGIQFIPWRVWTRGESILIPRWGLARFQITSTIVFSSKCRFYCLRQKVHIPQCLFPRRNWDPPTPSPLSECVPLPYQPKEGGTHSPADEGVGESQFGRLEKKLSILSTLWLKIHGYFLQRRQDDVNFILLLGVSFEKASASRGWIQRKTWCKPELTITSPYVHSRVDSNTFTMGQIQP